MTKENVTDAELEELMAQLEEQSVELMAEAKPEPAPTTPEPESEPEPVPAPKSEPAAAASIAAAPVETRATPVAPSAQPASAGKSGLLFYVDAAEFMAETRVSDTSLDKCLVEQSGLRAYYGNQAARAEAQHARVKVRFEVVEAQLFDKHRKALLATGEKVTEKAVENAVKLDPAWLKGKNTVIEAETISNINRSLVESLKDRRDMLIQLGADRRDEFKGAARVIAERDEREAMANRAASAAATAFQRRAA